MISCRDPVDTRGCQSRYQGHLAEVKANCATGVPCFAGRAFKNVVFEPPVENRRRAEIRRIPPRPKTPMFGERQHFTFRANLFMFCSERLTQRALSVLPKMFWQGCAFDISRRTVASRYRLKPLVKMVSAEMIDDGITD